MAPAISPSGPVNARLVVVGRDCGWQEVRDGMGFVGPAGKLLWHPTQRTGAADLAGVLRHETLVTNVVNRQPSPDNDWSKHAEADVVAGVESLQRLLAAHPRTLVVALGEQAALACAGITPSVDSARVNRQFAEHFGGSITACRGYIPLDRSGMALFPPILIACHPAFLLRTWHPWWATFCWDWQKAARIRQAGSWAPHEVQVEVVASAEALMSWWQTVPKPSVVACDVETMLNGCIGFAADPHHAGVVPGGPKLSHPLFAQLGAILNNTEGVDFVLQNGQFDWTMFARAGMVPEREWPQFRHDLMLDWHAYAPLLAGSQKDEGRKKGGKRTQKSLEFLAGLLLDGAVKWKDYDFASEDDQYRLCGIDNGYTLGCWRELRRRLEAA